MQDVFDVFLIYRCMQKDYFDINLKTLMMSLGKYSQMERFKDIYRNLNISIDENNQPFIDLNQIYDQERKERKILEYPNEKNIFCIIIPNEDLEKLKESYSDDVLYLFESLMFNVSQDLEYGLDGWSLVAEDEYIKIPNYPGVVTGEFIGKKKTERVLKKVKKQAIENLKDSYK